MTPGSRIKHAMGHSKFFSIERWIQLINSKVRPHLEYLSGVWGYCQWNKASTTYTKYLKAALGLEKKSPVALVYDETNMMPLSIRRHIRMLKLWAKVLTYPKTHYLRQLYEKDKKYQYSRWAGRIRFILVTYGLGDFWRTQSTTGKKK